jgi:hypothetical protein
MTQSLFRGKELIVCLGIGYLIELSVMWLSALPRVSSSTIIAIFAASLEAK